MYLHNIAAYFKHNSIIDMFEHVMTLNNNYKGSISGQRKL